MTAEPNPYQAPASDLGLDEPASTLESAGKGRRFGTLVIDYLCYFVCSLVLGIFVGIFFGEAGLAVFEGISGFLIGLLMLTSYYVFFEGLWGRTPGKLIFGTVVVDDHGRKPPLGTIIKRTLLRFIPFEPFSLLLGEQAWHDSMSDTRVVRVSRS